MHLGLHATELAGLGLEGYTMAVVNNGSSLVLTGGRGAPRGALYAVRMLTASTKTALHTEFDSSALHCNCTVYLNG